MRLATATAGVILAVALLPQTLADQSLPVTKAIPVVRINYTFPKHHHRHRIYWQGPVTASWYNDAGTHCCGVYAYYGVADCGYEGLCYPQGTRIEFLFRGRKVVATVDDHGPYANGASFDLNRNTAAALHFTGVQGVRYHPLH